MGADRRPRPRRRGARAAPGPSSRPVADGPRARTIGSGGPRAFDKREGLRSRTARSAGRAGRAEALPSARGVSRLGRGKGGDREAPRRDYRPDQPEPHRPGGQAGKQAPTGRRAGPCTNKPRMPGRGWPACRPRPMRRPRRRALHSNNRPSREGSRRPTSSSRRPSMPPPAPAAIRPAPQGRAGQDATGGERWSALACPGRRTGL
jgi:hypothetical protein